MKKKTNSKSKTSKGIKSEVAAAIVMAFFFFSALYFLIPPPEDELELTLITESRVDLSVQEGFELDPYLGEWYEIARLPQKFQQGCTCSKAIYEESLSTVKVTNVCYEDGSWRSVQGNAWTTETPGVLEVSFFPFTKADYRVLSFSESYSWAVVGSNENSLWILSREPELSRQVKQDIVSFIDDRGFNTDRLIFNEDC